MNRILFVNGQVFDGTGAPAVPADLVVRGDRIESVRAGGGTEIEPGDQVVDCTGATVINRISIGAEALVAAGAVVIADVAPGARVAGVPARPMDRGPA